MGKVFFAQALVTYFTVITDFGFNYSSTRDISKNRNNLQKVSEIYSITMNAKLFLVVVSFLLFLGIIYLVPDFRKDVNLFLYSFPIVLGQAILPFWLFQGLERMKFITIINFISKFTFLLIIVCVLTEAESFRWINFSLGMSTVLASLVILIYATAKLGLELRFINPMVFLKRLNTDQYLFYSMLSSTMLTNSNILILGFFSNPIIVGQYGIAEKIFTTIRQMLGLFSLGTYPRVCLYIEESRQSVIDFFRSTYAYFNLLVILGCISLYLTAPYAIRLFTGENNPEIVTILYFLIPALLAVSLNIAPNHTIMALNQTKKYSLVFLIAAIINLVLNFALVIPFKASGTAIAVLMTESLLTFGLFILLSGYWKRAEIFNIFVPKAVKF